MVFYRANLFKSVRLYRELHSAWPVYLECIIRLGSKIGVTCTLCFYSLLNIEVLFLCFFQFYTKEICRFSLIRMLFFYLSPPILQCIPECTIQLAVSGSRAVVPRTLCSPISGYVYTIQLSTFICVYYLFHSGLIRLMN
jgi:hypothetical protein